MLHIKGIPLTSLPRVARGVDLPRDRPVHVFIAVGDHYEPNWGAAPAHIQRERVTRWVEGYPRACAGLTDSRGRPPQHTFFYPAEDYQPEHLERLAALCRQGYGDVDVHLHHHDDTAEQLRETLEGFKESLTTRHGLLRQNEQGQTVYGFIHGNWALDNSRPDGKWCGVNNELTILKETGCYADFTMPSAPSDTQTSAVNLIYYAVDDPIKPKSHDRGRAAAVGQSPPGDGLLMIQGPLALDWRKRKWGLLPRLENGDLRGNRAASWARFQLWLKAGVTVRGRPDWRFIKLHTHGAPEDHAAMFLGEPARKFHLSLAEQARNIPNMKYYYVTAHEMALLVHQCERGVAEPQFERVAVNA